MSGLFECLSGCVTLISLSASLLLLRTIHYYAELGQRSVFPTCEVPEHFVGQVTVLKYFSHYMEENLMDVSEISLSPTPFPLICRSPASESLSTPSCIQIGFSQVATRLIRCVFFFLS